MKIHSPSDTSEISSSGISSSWSGSDTSEESIVWRDVSSSEEEKKDGFHRVETRVVTHYVRNKDFPKGQKTIKTETVVVRKKN